MLYPCSASPESLLSESYKCNYLAAGNAHLDIIRPGDSTLFPRGLLHFEINLGTENATYISALNSQNPGTLVHNLPNPAQ
jgi:hypothetical protein